MSDALGGLVGGAIYALIALGLVLAHRVSGVVNFAHGAVATFAAYVAYSLRGAGLPISVLGALAAGFALGAVTERLVARAARGGHEAQMLVTIALFMLGDGLLGLGFGADPRAFEHAFAALGAGPLSPSLPWSARDLALLGVAGATTIGLAGFLARTRAGLGIRAIGEDPEGAAQLGVPVARLTTLTWGLAGVLGAIAGLLLVPRLFLDPGVMFTPLLEGFAAAVLGGFASIPGALLGGLVLGVLEALTGAWGGPGLQGSLPFVVIITVLWIRPTGLTGRRQRRRL